ncbi:hypothetical protein [uncultured Imperialibacter sp.]|uniref:hypothetical protein n=1 Tax=uncultured Imperialibacter sp. TaxID=1672639 RepID=UPI0030DB4903
MSSRRAFTHLKDGLHRHPSFIAPPQGCPAQGLKSGTGSATPYKAVDTRFSRCRHGQLATLKEPSDTGCYRYRLLAFTISNSLFPAVSSRRASHFSRMGLHRHPSFIAPPQDLKSGIGSATP